VYIKYSLDFLRPITTAEAFEAVDWLAYSFSNISAKITKIRWCALKL